MEGDSTKRQKIVASGLTVGEVVALIAGTVKQEVESLWDEDVQLENGDPFDSCVGESTV